MYGISMGYAIHIPGKEEETMRTDASHYRMKECDREHICRKYYNPDEPHNGYARFSYHGYDYDETTGLSDEEIKKGLREMMNGFPADIPHEVAKAECIAFVLDHTRIDVNDFDWYVGFYSWGRVIREDTIGRWQNEVRKLQPEVWDEIGLYRTSGTADIWPDYEHAVPDWDAIMGLGFPGLLKRARTIRRQNEEISALTAKQKAYYDSIEIALSAVLRLLRRFAEYAKAQQGEKTAKIAACLTALENGAPSNTYEALQLMYLYFMISESVDCYQVRSLGDGFDRVISPYYFRDLAENRASEEELDDYIAYFLMEFYAIGNIWGQPLFLGGTSAEGSSRWNDFSRRVLSLWDDLDIHNPKIQVLFGDSTPKEVRYQVYDIIRRGKYMTIVCEKGASEGVKTAAGCSDAQARDFLVSGCYEPVVRGGILIEAGYPNLLKCVSLAMRNGHDPMTGRQVGVESGRSFDDFEAFFTAFDSQLGHLCERIIALAGQFERYLDYVNPAILLSATREWSLRRMEDGYASPHPYSFSLIELNAFASAVDALLAVEYLVFDKKIISLDGLVKAMDADWEGYDDLHRIARYECPKWGSGDRKADALALRVSERIAAHLVGKKNIRGSVFLVEYHGAMEYAWQGEKTEATPDGRHKGAETSKNASPCIGSDTNGATALLLSCTASVAPERAPAAFCADVMLHPSAVRGEEGLAAMDTLVKVYQNRHGIDVQFNVVSPETLRDAQAHPEQYRNLQIRVTGWNVLWNDIPKKLQDSYILRAETVTGN